MTPRVVPLINECIQHDFSPEQISRKHAYLVAENAIELLGPYQSKVFTITSDNGQEFAHHERIGKEMKACKCFAHPYHTWTRGLNDIFQKDVALNSSQTHRFGW